MPTDSNPNSLATPLPDSLATDPFRQQAWPAIRDRLRPGQREMADWQGGALAVSAVPGSGKSTGMAAAAALTVARYRLHSQRQLVLVTFTRSAAANLRAKIRDRLRELSLPLGGFAVYTLHGLALNIATRHPDLSGLNLDAATVVTPNQSHQLIRTCVERWIAESPRRYRRLIEGRQFDGEETERLRRQSVLRTEILPNLAHTAIREAKSSGLLPQDLDRIEAIASDEYETLAIAAELYRHYQDLLQAHQCIDYDDMILAALRSLEDESARQLWQDRVFGVFEDEAQDSSPLQTRLLQILAQQRSHPDAPNLVRVGDPNQAINSTFTPADPIYFRHFCQQCRVRGQLATIDRAGRSHLKIIEAANYTLEWVNEQWQAGRWHSTQLGDRQASALPFRAQSIRPVEPDDPQPDANPDAIGGGLEIYTPDDIYQTVEWIGKRAMALLEQTPHLSAAVLTRTNSQSEFVVAELNRLYGTRLNVYDVTGSDRHSRVPVELLVGLQFIERPHSSDRLKALLSLLVERKLIPTQDLDTLAGRPEQFLYPDPLAPPQSDPVRQARQKCVGLLRARLELPPAQLPTFVALTLHYDAAELATADKLADRVACPVGTYRAILPTSNRRSLAAILAAIAEIVSSERFEPVDTDNAESRYARSGQLTVMTMHKAKGLDWDCVFLPFLQEKNIPGHLWISPQFQFLGDFTLKEVARARIRTGLWHREMSGSDGLPAIDPDPARSWETAKQLKTAEEFRLLYVAMTRAKRLLWMSAARDAPFTWNQPDNLETALPCPVLPALLQRFPESAPPGSTGTNRRNFRT